MVLMALKGIVVDLEGSLQSLKQVYPEEIWHRLLISSDLPHVLSLTGHCSDMHLLAPPFLDHILLSLKIALDSGP